MAHGKTNCPDCDTELEAIKLIDNADRGTHTLMSYAAGDADRSVFLGQFPVEGRIVAEMCPSCGRVLLHARPK